MKIIPVASLDNAARVFVVSNTPMYLYKHLRADPVVLQLARDVPTQSIIKLLSFYTGRGKKRAEALVAAYVCLIALSFKPSSEFREFLEEFESSVLCWLADLRGIIFGTKYADGRVSINVQAIRDNQPTRSAAATTRITQGTVISQSTDANGTQP
jgi:hypothetical protein